MQVDANLNINGKQPVDIDGGRLILGGFSTSGTIAITSGMLEFAQTRGFLQSPETESDGFNTKLAFTGNSGAVQFDGTSDQIPVAPALRNLRAIPHLGSGGRFWRSTMAGKRDALTRRPILREAATPDWRPSCCLRPLQMARSASMSRFVALRRAIVAVPHRISGRQIS
jgi:hypothetical protein